MENRFFPKLDLNFILFDITFPKSFFSFVFIYVWHFFPTSSNRAILCIFPIPSVTNSDWGKIFCKSNVIYFFILVEKWNSVTTEKRIFWIGCTSYTLFSFYIILKKIKLHLWNILREKYTFHGKNNFIFGFIFSSLRSGYLFFKRFLW